jgi:hypothetical protein
MHHGRPFNSAQNFINKIVCIAQPFVGKNSKNIYPQKASKDSDHSFEYIDQVPGHFRSIDLRQKTYLGLWRLAKKPELIFDEQKPRSARFRICEN